MQRLITALLAALTTTQAKAAAAMGGFAALAADITHADKWPWIVSVFGAIVVMAKVKEQSRFQGFANGVVSVMLGGLGAGFVAEYTRNALGVAPPVLLVAFILSALWPVAVSTINQLWPVIRARVEKKIAGSAQ